MRLVDSVSDAMLWVYHL